MTSRTTHSKHLFKDPDIPSNYTPPIIIGYYIKTPENMGHIIRLAHNFGSSQVFFVTQDENIRNSKIKKTASSSYNSIPWSFCNEKELEAKIPHDYKWIAIETSSDSKSIFQTQLPSKLAMIVGNEITGIDTSFLDRCHKIVHIPLLGNNTSMNVSHALSAALSEWLRQIL